MASTMTSSVTRGMQSSKCSTMGSRPAVRGNPLPFQARSAVKVAAVQKNARDHRDRHGEKESQPILQTATQVLAAVAAAQMALSGTAQANELFDLINDSSSRDQMNKTTSDLPTVGQVGRSLADNIGAGSDSKAPGLTDIAKDAKDQIGKSLPNASDEDSIARGVNPLGKIFPNASDEDSKITTNKNPAFNDLSEVPNPFSPTPNKDNKNLGPNEVSKELIDGDGFPNSSEFDKATPGRAPGLPGDVGKAADDAKSAVQDAGSKAADKAKGLFDLSEVPNPASPTPNVDNRNLGPNEVSKELIDGPGFPNSSEFDKAAPGRSPTPQGSVQQVGSGGVLSLKQDKAAATLRAGADKVAEKGNGFGDIIKKLFGGR